jgi:hypothetical protein
MIVGFVAREPRFFRLMNIVAYISEPTALSLARLVACFFLISMMDLQTAKDSFFATRIV